MDFENIRLDKAAVLPLYRQLAEQIRQATEAGSLAEGTRLPPIRHLAATLGISPITVTQAYETLAAEGVAGGQVGRGTFILARPAPLPALSAVSATALSQPSPAWIEPPASLANSLAETRADYAAGGPSELTTFLKPTRLSEMNHLLQLALSRWRGSPADFFNLSRGSPATELFPVARFRQALEEAGASLEQEDRASFQYGPALGDPATREGLARYLTRFGFAPSPSEILLTTGSQQGLDLVARVFAGPGETVLVENPTYTAALDIFEQRGLNLLPVPLDGQGLELEQLARLVERYHPKMLYCIPTCQSPTGQTLSAERRPRLVELARRYNFLIVEDDTCNEFYYGDPPPAAIKSYDQAGHVLYLKSFSKQIFPMVRLGCLVTAPLLLEKLAEAKQVFDRATSLPLARTVLKHITSASFEREVEQARQVYRARRDIFLAALERELAGTGCSWSYPEGGLSVLLTLPRGIQQLDLHQAAAEQGIGVLPGKVFYPIPTEAPHALRLSFSDNSLERLQEAAHRLRLALHKMLRQRPPESSASSFVAAV